jgi:cytochrome P450
VVAIGASLWHLASHPEDRRRLVDRPGLMPLAMEELLRAYAPVTMARLVARDVVVGDAHMKEGDWVLLPFPAANRDPSTFDRADEVVIDRQVNRHAAFGLGIHRCVGSNLARMELRVALEEWLSPRSRVLAGRSRCRHLVGRPGARPSQPPDPHRVTARPQASAVSSAAAPRRASRAATFWRRATKERSFSRACSASGVRPVSDATFQTRSTWGATTWSWWTARS